MVEQTWQGKYKRTSLLLGTIQYYLISINISVLSKQTQCLNRSIRPYCEFLYLKTFTCDVRFCHPIIYFFQWMFRWIDLHLESFGKGQNENAENSPWAFGFSTCLSFSPDGRYLASASRYNITIWLTEVRNLDFIILKHFYSDNTVSSLFFPNKLDLETRILHHTEINCFT